MTWRAGDFPPYAALSFRSPPSPFGFALRMRFQPLALALSDGFPAVFGCSRLFLERFRAISRSLATRVARGRSGPYPQVSAGIESAFAAWPRLPRECRRGRSRKSTEYRTAQFNAVAARASHAGIRMSSTSSRAARGYSREKTLRPEARGVASIPTDFSQNARLARTPSRHRRLHRGASTC